MNDIELEVEVSSLQLNQVISSITHFLLEHHADTDVKGDQF